MLSSFRGMFFHVFFLLLDLFLLQTFEKILLTPWEHESQVVSYAHCLGTLNEMLSHSAVLIQGYSESDHPADPQFKDLPFPFDFSGWKPSLCPFWDLLSSFACSWTLCVSWLDPLYPKNLHGMLKLLEEKLGLASTCGYLRMIRLGRPSEDEVADHWVPLDIHFGIPLFDQNLNKIICDRIQTSNLFDSTHLRTHSMNSRALALRLLHFIASHQDRSMVLDAEGSGISKVALPTHNVCFDETGLHSLAV